MAQLARFSPAAVVQRITRGGDALGEPTYTIDQIVEEATKHRPNLNAALVHRAYETAVAAHEGQLRVSGEPYVTHPVAVTYYLATLQMDAETLAAALLHDVPEDTDFTLADLEKAFGREVTNLVDGVTKLSKFGSARTMEEQQAENIRKMFMAMAEDVRVVIIKLADRLHNMRTLDALPAEKQERIARQTMEIYAPLAHRLGMWQIKWELEDLAFKYTEPEKYRQLVEILADQRRSREGFVNKSIGILRKELEKVEIKAEISGRPKHLYSISKKMERKGAEFTEIYDLNAIRVLVDDVKDCYAALGIVHSLWRPVPGQFDDYIAMPKANMYQSLHTAVIGPEAKPLEVQIRTYRMHEVAEAGIAAHWRYKEGSRSDRKYDEKLAWVRNLMDWQREVTDPTEFVEGLKLDVFQDQVFVFTPKGDVKDLPRDATPLDFAYRIHTDVGHRTIGAKVNNRLVPLDYRLRNGDIVEIVTTKAAHGPSRDWLNIVRTSRTRARRSAPGSSASSATRTSRRARTCSTASCVAWRTRRSRRSTTPSSPRSRSSTSSASSTTSTPPSATARSRPHRSSASSRSTTTPPSPCPRWRHRPRRPRPASRSRASATCSCASRSAAHRSPATTSPATSPVARASPCTEHPVRPCFPSGISSGSSTSSGSFSGSRPIRSPFASRRWTGLGC